MRASPGTTGTTPGLVAGEERATGIGRWAPSEHEDCGSRCWRDPRDERAPRGGVRFHILFVCTANICRSPLAERLTRSALGPCPAVRVSSAGTHARPGMEMDRRARGTLTRLGGDPAGFTSSLLTPARVAAADLVLTATSRHRAQAVTLHLAAATRTFTIAEFGALARAVQPERILRHADPVRRARVLVEEARALRGLVRVDEPDIADPYGGSWLAYRLAGRTVTRSLAAPLRLLTPPPDV
ncbi:hypothetical protein [Streptosporangium sp. NPDC023615]|uniref:arsenate reductase/protein-tyrosine-phosphatase family protein n=1 Tax=Streptosporangium sp. NPDC023615 TaxID=3154794 RepID=UPI0034481ACD